MHLVGFTKKYLIQIWTNMQIAIFWVVMFTRIKRCQYFGGEWSHLTWKSRWNFSKYFYIFMKIHSITTFVTVRISNLQPLNGLYIRPLPYKLHNEQIGLEIIWDVSFLQWFWQRFQCSICPTVYTNADFRTFLWNVVPQTTWSNKNLPPPPEMSPTSGGRMHS